jgi:hypothetical protein
MFPKPNSRLTIALAVLGLEETRIRSNLLPSEPEDLVRFMGVVREWVDAE